MRSFSLVGISLLAVLLRVTPLQAAPPDANAKRLYTSGLAAYDAGRYELAIAAFEEAYRLAPADLLLFDLAQAYRKQFLTERSQQTRERALALYWRFLASPAKGRERLLAIEALEELLALSTASQPLASVEPEEAAPSAAPAAPLPPPSAAASTHATPRTTTSPPRPTAIELVRTTSMLASHPSRTPHARERPRTRRWWIVGGVLGAVAVTVGVGVAVGLTVNRATDPEPTFGRTTF